VNAAKINSSISTKLLLLSGPIDEHDRTNAFVPALQGKNVKVIEQLLIHGPITEECINWAIPFAIEQKREDIVKLLLAYLPVTDRCMNEAIYVAIWHQQEEITKLLLAKAPLVLDDVAKSVCGATSYGWESIVEQLLARGLIDVTNRTYAFRFAIQYKQESIARLLLTNGPVALEDLYQTCCELVLCGWESVIDQLLACPTMRWPLNKVLWEAGENKNWSLIERILVRNDLLYEVFRVRLVGFAAKDENEHMVKKLLVSGKIPDEDIDTIIGFSNAAIQQVLESYRSCQQRYTVIETAIKAMDIAKVKTMLVDPLISWQILNLLTTAIDSKNLEVIEMILQSKQYIRPEDFGKVLEHAVASEDVDISRFVFNLTFFSKRFSQPSFLQKILVAFPQATALQMCSHAVKKEVEHPIEE